MICKDCISEQIPKASKKTPGKWKTAGGGKNGLQDSKSDPVQQYSARRLHWVWSTWHSRSWL